MTMCYSEKKDERRNAMNVDVSLNIHWEAPDEVWEKVDEVFRSMRYYDELSDTPKWTAPDINLVSSNEPSGLQIYGEMPEYLWEEWYDELCEKLTDALGYEIGDVEDGYEFKYDWDEE